MIKTAETQLPGNEKSSKDHNNNIHKVKILIVFSLFVTWHLVRIRIKMKKMKTEKSRKTKTAATL